MCFVEEDKESYFFKELEARRQEEPQLQGENYSLEDISFLAKKMDLLGFCPTIHVAGTNGKGSTVHYIATLLSAESYERVGSLTSPHFFSYKERIQIYQRGEGELIASIDFSEVLRQVVVAESIFLKRKLRHFSLLTLTALLYFKEKNVDIIVVEVGLGGRYDSTNIIPSLVQVVTSLSLDHTEIFRR